MTACIVSLRVRAGAEDKLVADFTGTFRPAISAQPGFQRVALLRPPPGQPWLLDIRFTDEPSRLAWVATPLHQEVWPRLEASCEQADTVVYEEQGI